MSIFVFNLSTSVRPDSDPTAGERLQNARMIADPNGRYANAIKIMISLNPSRVIPEFASQAENVRPGNAWGILPGDLSPSWNCINAQGRALRNGSWSDPKVKADYATAYLTELAGKPAAIEFLRSIAQSARQGRDVVFGVVDSSNEDAQAGSFTEILKGVLHGMIDPNDPSVDAQNTYYTQLCDILQYDLLTGATKFSDQVVHSAEPAVKEAVDTVAPVVSVAPSEGLSGSISARSIHVAGPDEVSAASVGQDSGMTAPSMSASDFNSPVYIRDHNEFDPARGFAEYAFARAIEDYNFSVASHNGNSYIHSSEGRELHRQWMDVINRNGGSFSYMFLTDSFRRVFGSRMQGDAPWGDIPENWSYVDESGRTVLRAHDLPADKLMQDKYIAEFQQLTGIDISRNGRSNRESKGMSFDEQHYLPISPFDERFQYRSTVLDNGNRILYAPLSKMLACDRDPDGIFRLHYQADPHKESNIVLSKQRFVDDRNRPDRTEKRSDSFQFVDVGPLNTEEDRTGLSILRPYMDEDSFRTAALFMRDVPSDKVMTPAMLDRSVHILNRLQSKGIPFTIKPDQKCGQLKACITGTKLSFRIADTSDNPGLIGRAYKDGFAYWWKTQISSPFAPSTVDIDATMDYVLGGVVRRTGTKSGIIGVASSGAGTKAASTGVRQAFIRKSSSSNRLELQAVAGNIPNPHYDPKLAGEYRKYHNAKKAKQAGNKNAADIPNPVQNPKDLYKVYTSLDTCVCIQSARSLGHEYFITNDDAESFLRNSVEAARANFRDRVNIDWLVSEYEAHKDDPDYTPAFTGDRNIAPIQSIYWDVLCGRRVLYAPDNGILDEKLFGDLLDSVNEEAVGENDAMEPDEVIDRESPVTWDTERQASYYSKTPAENIRQHLDDNMDILFGRYEPMSDGKRFSPAFVASFMDSGYGMARNKENLISAMRKLGYTGDELRGDDFDTGAIKDHLIKFDEASSHKMSEHDSPFMKCVLSAIVNTLRSSACDVNEDDILIDKNGVVRYKATMCYSNKSGVTRDIVGEIGQIFEPDEDGIVETKYNGSRNRLFTPGYEAYFVPEDESNRDSLEKRIRMRGLPQVLMERIGNTIREDILVPEEGIDALDSGAAPVHVGSPTSVNGAYRGLYHTSYKIEIEQQKDDNGRPVESLKDCYLRECRMRRMNLDVLRKIFDTNRGMYHFGSEYRDGATVAADYRYKHGLERGYSVFDMTNDNSFDAYAYAGHRDLSCPAKYTEHSSDPLVSGSGSNIGMIRYLGIGAGVNPDGTLKLSENENPIAPVFSITIKETGPDGKPQEYNLFFRDNVPADRTQMAFSNLMNCNSLAGAEEDDEVWLAYATFKGFTFDDGCVISKEFAENHLVPDGNGGLRSLRPGDKICGLDGNKSVISLIVDRDMPDYEAEKMDLKDAVEFFRLNPKLSIVQAPYSGLSRQNASAYRISQVPGHKDVLHKLDGTNVAGGMIRSPVIVTSQTAEKHTNVYGDEEVKAGQGRRLGGQALWCFDARGDGCLDELRRVFGTNMGAIMNYREYLNAIGYDFSETGALRVGYQPHPGEIRHVFKVPDVSERGGKTNRELSSEFINEVGYRGGMMELPFPLEFKMTHKQLTAVEHEAGYENYMLPVLSAHLRSGQEFDTAGSGMKKVHDYTNHYQQIYDAALDYMKYSAQYSDLLDRDDWDIFEDPDAPLPSGGEYDELLKKMEACQRKAQAAFDWISDDVWNKQFGRKQNLIRSDIMSKRMPDSGTFIWTPDASLKINQIGISSQKADELGIKTGDRVIILRDPLLHPSGMRDMEVVVRDDAYGLCGISINPIIAQSFDGDFDGDSAGLITRKEINELLTLAFSFETNLLNFSHERPDGNFDLWLNTSMDLASREAVDKEQREGLIADMWTRGRSAGRSDEDIQNDIDKLSPTLAERRELLTLEANKHHQSINSILDAAKNMNQLSPDEQLEVKSMILRFIDEGRAITDRVSEYVADAVYKDNIAVECVSFENPVEHLKSYNKMVEHGAKGSAKKLLEYAQYAGIEVGMNEDGTLDLDSAVDVYPKRLTPVEAVSDVEQAMAIKAHGTSDGGTKSINAMTFVRNMPAEKLYKRNSLGISSLEALLAATRLSTQGLLQAKHDAAQAKRLYDVLQNETSWLWKGCALDPNGEGRYKQRWGRDEFTGEYGPIRATPEEWVDTFMDVHENLLGLKGEINRAQVELVAELLTDDTGHIMNVVPTCIEDGKESRMALMDYLSFHHSDAADALAKAADQHLNLFGSVCPTDEVDPNSFSSVFMPQRFVDNANAVKEGRFEDVKPICPSDCKAGDLKMPRASAYGIELNTGRVSDDIRRRALNRKFASREATVVGSSVHRSGDESIDAAVHRSVPAQFEAVEARASRVHSGVSSPSDPNNPYNG